MTHRSIETTHVRVRLTEAGAKALVTNRTKLTRCSEGTLLRPTRRGNVMVLVDGYATPYEYAPHFWELIS